MNVIYLFVAILFLNLLASFILTFLVARFTTKRKPLKIARIILILALLIYSLPFIAYLLKAFINPTESVTFSTANSVQLTLKPLLSDYYDIDLYLSDPHAAEIARNCFYKSMSSNFSPTCESLAPKNISVKINDQEKTADDLYKTTVYILTDTASLSYFKATGGQTYHITVTFNSPASADQTILQSHPTVIVKRSYLYFFSLLGRFFVMYLPFAVMTLICILVYIPKKLRERESKKN